MTTDLKLWRRLLASILGILLAGEIVDSFFIIHRMRSRLGFIHRKKGKICSMSIGGVGQRVSFERASERRFLVGNSDSLIHRPCDGMNDLIPSTMIQEQLKADIVSFIPNINTD